MSLETAERTVLAGLFSLSSPAPPGPTFLQRALTYLIEEIPLKAYLCVFVLVVLGCGWLYSVLTAYGHGVNIAALGFLDGVFFSIVTITSLGYGDLYPIGFSRVIAGAEVLFGLTFMGIMVAKVTSRRLSYHVQRLFVSDAQQRLDGFAEKFTAMRAPLVQVTKELGYIYERTPEPRPPGVERSDAVERFGMAVDRLHFWSLALHKYFSFEVEQYAYFKIVPGDSVRRVGETLDEALYHMGQLIISLPADAKPVVINSESRRKISQALTALEQAADIVGQQCPDEETVDCFRRVQETCRAVRNSHFATPTPDVAPGPPDQEVPSESDAPEESLLTRFGD